MAQAKRGTLRARSLSTERVSRPEPQLLQRAKASCWAARPHGPGQQGAAHKGGRGGRAPRCAKSGELVSKVH